MFEIDEKPVPLTRKRTLPEDFDDEVGRMEVGTSGVMKGCAVYSVRPRLARLATDGRRWACRKVDGGVRIWRLS